MRLNQYDYGFSPPLQVQLDNQVPDARPRSVLQALQCILSELDIDGARYLDTISINRHLAVDERASERLETRHDLPPAFFVAFYCSLPQEGLGSNRVKTVKRLDFISRVERERHEGSLRIEVKPPDIVTVIQNHLVITGTIREPLTMLDYYRMFFCLPEEAGQLYANTQQSIVNIYAAAKRIDFTAEPRRRFELPSASSS